MVTNMAPSAAVNKRDDDIPSTSENFDLEKTAEEAKSLIEKVIKDVGKKSATRQLLFGSASGWATGFIMMKLGKAAAFTVGSGILALQLANSSGYININWDKLTRGVERVAERVEDSTSDKKQGLLKKVRNIVETNSIMAAGFTGGFFLGVAYS
ncbi:FUN14 domain-containing protein 1-like isoform X2 [Aphis craccivora]|uniref:FUN14 domain-containing protein 1-like isoform X2 n=2 Tax=Aphis TaxID=464929 RepID=A0A6G0ZHQ4_APHCR|nr:FUN14 domain-containing protein 1-like isoform X2 [Aphis craccivora]